ncbi:hypothetical protein HOLleu_42011 [Holothuria leucospilota]|uniref:DDE Tnp4 domain-containing protein n=1 Tax=Holothuria leucospilota TaxID=206669 RepID=A0A9Q0YCA2_HOLLE|nr:hypothetical protein HOLleu_42011 [Holothuria leucospilota]
MATWGSPNLPIFTQNDVTSMPYVFVGDDAFSMSENLLKPYGGDRLEPDQRIFNYRLSRASFIKLSLFCIEFELKCLVDVITDLFPHRFGNGRNERFHKSRLKSLGENKGLFYGIADHLSHVVMVATRITYR